jgi:hypothetical protein
MAATTAGFSPSRLKFKTDSIRHYEAEEQKKSTEGGVVQNFIGYPSWDDVAPSCRVMSLGILFSFFAVIASLVYESVSEKEMYLRWMFLAAFFYWWTICRCMGVLAGGKRAPKLTREYPDIFKYIENDVSGSMVDAVGRYSDKILDQGPPYALKTSELPLKPKGIAKAVYV